MMRYTMGLPPSTVVCECERENRERCRSTLITSMVWIVLLEPHWPWKLSVFCCSVLSLSLLLPVITTAMGEHFDRSAATSYFTNWTFSHRWPLHHSDTVIAFAAGKVAENFLPQFSDQTTRFSYLQGYTSSASLPFVSRAAVIWSVWTKRNTMWGHVLGAL